MRTPFAEQFFLTSLPKDRSQQVKVAGAVQLADRLMNRMCY